LIEDKCSDGFVSLKEECDDGNNINGDGCSSLCKLEKGTNCKNVRNEGPSECFNTLGWTLTLKTDMLIPSKVTITFSDEIIYDINAFKSYDSLFKIEI
jgi:cysteine-rich repeat protein